MNERYFLDRPYTLALKGMLLGFFASFIAMKFVIPQKDFVNNRFVIQIPNINNNSQSSEYIIHKRYLIGIPVLAGGIIGFTIGQKELSKWSKGG